MRNLLIAILIMMGMASCNSFKINVNLENSNGKTVYLQRYDDGKMNTLDSVVAKNNKAVFKIKKSDNQDAYCIMVKGWRRPLTLFADNQNVMITGDYQNYNEIKISASESQKKLDAFMTEVNKIENDKEIYYCVLDFVKQNFDNPIAPYVLYRYKWAFQLDDLKRLDEMMPADMQSAYRTLVNKYMQGLKLTSVGMPYIDFMQKDVNGEDFKLSSVIGKSKIIILDFWASWCPDCRKENPGLVAVYNKFKNKGLDIVSVSLDTDAEAWKNAIEKDNLSWKNHVSDLKGWANAVAEMYTIAYIPQNLILNENGVILEKNLPTEKMEDFFGSILK